MTLVDRDVAVETVLRAVRPTDGDVVHVDREVREAGTFDLGGEQRRLERPALLVFRDRMPWSELDAPLHLRTRGPRVR